MLKRWLIKKAYRILDKYGAWPPPVVVYRESNRVPEGHGPVIVPFDPPKRAVAHNFNKM